MPICWIVRLSALALVAAAAGARSASVVAPLPGGEAWTMQASIAYPDGGTLVGGRFFSALGLPLPGGHWLVVGDRLVRFDGGGQVVSVSEQDPRGLYGAGVSAGASLAPDGEVLAWSGTYDCLVALIAQDGSQRWRRTVAPSVNCGEVLAHSGRLHQVLGATSRPADVDVLSLDRRGQPVWQAHFPGEHAGRDRVRLAAAENGGVLAASVLRGVAGAPTPRPVVALFDRAGDLRYRWEGPPVAGATLLALVPAATGGHWLAYGDSGGGVLKVRLDSALQPVSTRPIPAPAGQRIGSVLIDGSGEGYALQDIGNGVATQWVYRIGPDALGWQHPSQVVCPTLTTRVCRVLGGNGDLVLVDLRQVQRIAATGVRRSLRQLSLPALGSIRWLGESPEGVAAIAVVGSLSRLEWLQESGLTVAAASPPRFPRPDASPAIAAVGPDGESYVALPGPAPQAGYLESIDADGGRRWLVELPAPYVRSAMTSGGDSVCLLHIGHTACLAAQSGTLRWVQQHEPSLYRWGRMLPDGTLLSIDSRSVFGGGLGFVQRQVVTSYSQSDGPTWIRTLPVVLSEGQPVIGISEGGLVAFRDGSGRLAYLDRAGNEISTPVAVPVMVQRQFGDAGIVDDSGRVVFVSERSTGNVVSVQVVAADARGLAWQVHLGDYGNGVPAAVRLIPVAGGGVLVETTGLLSLPAREPMLGLIRIDIQGRPVWQRHWTARSTFQHRVALDDRGVIVRALQARDAPHLLLETLDAARGDSQSFVRLPCPAAGCGVENVRLLPGGRVHMVSNGGGDSALPHLVARLDRLPRDAIAPVRLGLSAGSFWQATELAGSGLSLSSPTPQRLVGAWATHSRRTEDSAAELRWYALEGQVPPGSSESAVVISEGSSGSFAVGPGGAARRVGAGRIRFRGCDAGVLQYRFDEGYNDGVEGSLPLTRLLPPGKPCLEPDDRLRPAQAIYDPDLTGHWYDPAAPGQGLEVARAAPSPSQSGLLFGIWFTFAPAPASTPTDPAQPRWFTLQGQGMEGGVVRSTVLVSIGGRFDDVAATNTFPVGTVELVTEGCDRLRLRYRFDDDEVAGDFRGLAGELQLRRLGACPGA